MAADEKHLAEAAQMAVDEINESGGVLGKQVEVVLRDGASDPGVFADKARELLSQEQVQAIFGCWMSSSRKAVKPIVEEHNSLLWYPIQYEGLEESANIVYTGSCLNQQIGPAVAWALSRGKRRCFLVGSDYVFPRTANNLTRALASQGGGCVLGERYVPLGLYDFAEVADAIAKARPEIVFNTINGDSNLAFFREFSRAVGDAGDCSIMSFSLAEISLREVPQESAGHYACWSYFQCLQTPENSRFLKKYTRRFGADAVVYDPIASAYTQVYLWKQAVERARSFDVSEILNNIAGCSVVGPGGVMEVQTNHHVKKLALIGQATPQGRFDVVWSSEHLIEPKPWLGVEDAELPTRALVLEALRQYPEVIHLNVELDGRVRERNAELERANEALKASETKYQDLYDNAPDMFVSVDAKTARICECNQTLARATGYAKEEIIGRPIFEMYHPDSMEGAKKAFSSFVATGEVHDAELQLMRKDGTTIEVSLNVSATRDEQGNILFSRSVWRDVTARKQAEKEREKLVAELEAQNAELERFTYTVSHDLKSPLITIKAYMGLLKEDLAGADADAVEDDVARVADAADKMKQLLDDLLELSRIGRTANPSEFVLLRQLAREAVDLVAGQIGQLGARVEISADLPVVFADRRRLLKVLQNLIDNALKYMGDQPQPWIEIGTRTADHQTILFVRDNGMGIEPQDHKNIFGLFNQLDKKAEGSGVGLALVKRIVEIRGGRIWVESDGPGRGSTFCFTVPSTKESAEIVVKTENFSASR